ncbi:beta-xylosidase, partial [bacterium]
FVSFHAKGAPSYVDGHVRMGIAAQLRTVDENFGIVSSFPQFKNTPIVIGESDPEGCAACQGPQLGYRNGTMYSSYTAASFARKLDLADKHGVNFEGALTWAFTFEDQPYFAGFRQLASNGIDLPVLNVFRMFSQMGGQRIAAESDGAVPLDAILKTGVREKPDVSALASRDGKRLAVMVWHYHDDDVAGPNARIRLKLSGLTNGSARVTEYRIDETHSNSYTVWKRMGSPQSPTAEQIRTLEKAGGLEKMPSRPRLKVQDGQAEIVTNLPRQAVSLFVIEA